MVLTSKECNHFYIMWFFPELHFPCLLFLPSPLQLKEENGAFKELKSNSATLWTTDQTTPGLVLKKDCRLCTTSASLLALNLINCYCIFFSDCFLFWNVSHLSDNLFLFKWQLHAWLWPLKMKLLYLLCV